jgi:hypothetical protein
MIKAVLKRGKIEPMQPIPEEWRDGMMLSIEAETEDRSSPEQIDRDFALLEILCQDSDPEDERMMEQALAEAKRLAKQQVAAEMKLSS